MTRTKRIAVRNAAWAAADVIRREILSGDLRPGQRLRAAELAQELGISRTPIREALLILEGEGLVDASPNKGATVKNYSAADIDDLYKLRAALEGYAARLATEKASASDIEELRRICARQSSLSVDQDTSKLIKENAHFHDTILRIAGSDRLRSMMTMVHLPYVYRSYFWRSSAQKENSDHYHKEITKAVEVHDPERAEFLMKAHLLASRDYLVPQLAPIPDKS